MKIEDKAAKVILVGLRKLLSKKRITFWEVELYGAESAPVKNDKEIVKNLTFLAGYFHF